MSVFLVLQMFVSSGSVAADYFKMYDRVCVINGTPVTDENVAKEYISCTVSAGSFTVSQSVESATE